MADILSSRPVRTRGEPSLALFGLALVANKLPYLERRSCRNMFSEWRKDFDLWELQILMIISLRVADLPRQLDPTTPLDENVD